MSVLNLFVAFLPLVLAVHGATLPSPDCDVDKHACACPVGTQYMECTTRAVIGAAVPDVRVMTGDFFHTEWMGVSPFSTEGEDNSVGSTRSLTVPTQVGTYNFTEELLVHDLKGDGSYTLKFKQQNVPVQFDSEFGPGSFSGFWVTRSASYAGPFRTQMVWNVYACQTGHVGFPEFHRLALNLATSTLQMQGKVKGSSEAPHSDCQATDEGLSSAAKYLFAQQQGRESHKLRNQADL